MNETKKGAVIIDSNKTEIAKLKKKWGNLKMFGDTMFYAGGGGFIISLLSPFEADAPAGAIGAIIVAVAGFVLKTAARKKLEGLSEKEQSDSNEKGRSK